MCVTAQSASVKHVVVHLRVMRQYHINLCKPFLQCISYISAQFWNPLFPGHFYKGDLYLNPARINNHIHSKVWDEIIHPFPNLNGWTVENLGMDKFISSHTYNWCNYLSMLRLKLSHVSSYITCSWQIHVIFTHIPPCNFTGIEVTVSRASASEWIDAQRYR